MNRFLSLAACAMLIPAVAQATVGVTYGSRDGGAAAFDAIVNSSGAVLNTLKLGSFGSGTAIGLPGGITITRNDGSFLSDQGVYTGGYNFPLPAESTTGNTINISPYRGARGAIDSGVTFSFANAVNSFGFEVGDWGTCCQPSALYMSFDDGAPIRVGISNQYADTFQTNKDAIVFVGAIDDAGSFSKVQFWGDGYGEYLVIGGTLRSANLDLGTIGDGSTFDSPLLPISVDTNTGGFNFGFVARPNVPVVIDPDVATGYTYLLNSGPAGSSIASVEWEDLGDTNGYDIFDLNDQLILANFMPKVGSVVDFASLGFGGLKGFKVSDIDVALGLDPADPTAFKTKLTFTGFTGPANLGVTQTPVTTFVPNAVPEPATWAMFIGGFGLVGVGMRRRQRVAMHVA